MSPSLADWAPVRGLGLKIELRTPSGESASTVSLPNLIPRGLHACTLSNLVCSPGVRVDVEDRIAASSTWKLLDATTSQKTKSNQNGKSRTYSEGRSSFPCAETQLPQNGSPRNAVRSTNLPPSPMIAAAAAAAARAAAVREAVAQARLMDIPASVAATVAAAAARSASRRVLVPCVLAAPTEPRLRLTSPSAVRKNAAARAAAMKTAAAGRAAAAKEAAASASPAAMAAAARAAAVERARRRATSATAASRAAGSDQDSATTAAAAAASRAAASRVQCLQPCQIELHIEAMEPSLAAGLRVLIGGAISNRDGDQSTTAGTIHCSTKPGEPLSGEIHIRGCQVKVHVQEVQGGGRHLAHGAAHPTNHLSIGDGLKRQRVVAVDATNSPPLAVEVMIGPGWCAQVRVLCREATPAEIERHAARVALLEAAHGKLADSTARGGGAYNTLLAQIKRGKLRGVEAVLLSRAEEQLKRMKPDDVAPVEELRAKLSLALCTTPPPMARDVEPCGVCVLPGCTVAQPSAGEKFEIHHGAAEAAFEPLRRLRKIGSEVMAHVWLYDVFASAAMRAVADGALEQEGYHNKPPGLVPDAHTQSDAGLHAPPLPRRRLESIREIQPLSALSEPVATGAAELPPAHRPGRLRRRPGLLGGVRRACVQQKGCGVSDQRTHGFFE